MSVSNIEPLKALNQLALEQESIESSQAAFENASKRLAHVRTSDIRSFCEWLALMRDWRFGADEIARDAVFAAVNECKHDLLRLAELRLNAAAREKKIKAAQKRAVIAASIISVEPPK